MVTVSRALVVIFFLIISAFADGEGGDSYWHKNEAIRWFSNLIRIVDDIDLERLLSVLTNEFNTNSYLKYEIANNAQVTKELFFPLISGLMRINGDLNQFPDIALTEDNYNTLSIASDNKLSVEFYQTITNCTTDPFFLGKLYALKMIDVLKNKELELRLTQSREIYALLEALPITMDQFINSIFETMYDQKMYMSTQQLLNGLISWHKWLMFRSEVQSYPDFYKIVHSFCNKWIDREVLWMDNEQMGIMNVLLRLAEVHDERHKHSNRA